MQKWQKTFGEMVAIIWVGGIVLLCIGVLGYMGVAALFGFLNQSVSLRRTEITIGVVLLGVASLIVIEVISKIRTKFQDRKKSIRCPECKGTARFIDIEWVTNAFLFRCNKCQEKFLVPFIEIVTKHPEYLNAKLCEE